MLMQLAGYNCFMNVSTTHTVVTLCRRGYAFQTACPWIKLPILECEYREAKITFPPGHAIVQDCC